jgi:hypothetical protein
MRGYSDEQLGMFSYVSVEDRIPADHPLRAIRKLVDKALVQISSHLASWSGWSGHRCAHAEAVPQHTFVVTL